MGVRLYVGFRVSGFGSFWGSGLGGAAVIFAAWCTPRFVRTAGGASFIVGTAAIGYTGRFGWHLIQNFELGGQSGGTTMAPELLPCQGLMWCEKNSAFVDSCLGSFTRFDEGPCYKALRLLTNEVFSKKARLADVQLQGYDIGASIIRIGFWGPLYYSCSNPQTGAGNYQGPKIIARRDPRLFTQSLAFGCQGFTHRLHGSSFWCS